MPVVNRRTYRQIATTLALALILFGQGVTALAQQPQRQGERRMSHEDRARLREDLGSARRDMYKGQRERPREQRPDDARRLSPEERDRLRRDLEDANRACRDAVDSNGRVSVCGGSRAVRKMRAICGETDG